MAEVKPLRLRQQKVQILRTRASEKPIARILVDHHVVHLDQIFDYIVPETLSTSAVTGALVEVEFGHSLTQGIILERRESSQRAGDLKEILKVLSNEPYLLGDQVRNIQKAAVEYGVHPWDILRRSVPPFSKVGERNSLRAGKEIKNVGRYATSLPKSLSSKLQSSEKLLCAIELPASRPYWNVIAEVALERLPNGTVLVLLPNDRELSLLEETLHNYGCQTIPITSTSGKADRYENFLKSRSVLPVIVLGTRSSTLLSLSTDSTIIVVDDVDESHFERRAPTWNTRELTQLRESDLSVIYIGTSLSLEIARRISEESLPLYRFPSPTPFRIRSEGSPEVNSYFSTIREGLAKGSVLVSVGATGYVTSFSCQKCRNIALCSCGGKLFFPSRSETPKCATCSTEFIDWRCEWCHENTPRIVKSGVIRRAEEFGRSFPRYSIVTSSSANPIALLPSGKHLVLSTPGVEPRGEYSAVIFLDLEGRLLRTTLRAIEELRLHILRTLSMLSDGGEAYFALSPADYFLQSIMRGKPLLAAEREIAERDSVRLPPHFCALLIYGERAEVLKEVLVQIPLLELLGPFLRDGKKTILVKAPRIRRMEIVQLLAQVNRVLSMRKEPLLTYHINPYSLN